MTSSLVGAITASTCRSAAFFPAACDPGGLVDGKLGAWQNQDVGKCCSSSCCAHQGSPLWLWWLPSPDDTFVAVLSRSLKNFPIRSNVFLLHGMTVPPEISQNASQNGWT